ncbi:MAG: radical SAM protein [Bacteroidales bacterium]|nr:radical SAM protein [Bacteroidales bacterium]MCF8399644.1 radical SAM protein [Bacteroidales bacterium]
MYDRFNRKINYLRISVTDRCNLRCKYCMPEEGIKLLPHEAILSYREIFDVVEVAVKLGIDKVRLTGGEPLVRKGIVDLVGMIASIKGIKDLSMTTNGILLKDFAVKLKHAGLQRVNISLDTMDPEAYKLLTRGGNIKRVFQGIRAAKTAGLHPIKINCVVWENSQEKDAQEVARFARENDLRIRFIHQMNLSTGEFSIVEGGEGGNCRKCNRLRLTSDGKIKPCLFSDLAFDVREMGAENAIRKAVGEKPKSGTYSKSSKFYNIGG